jgi:hypothetical protein
MIYEALSNVRHNGITYEAGQVVQDLGENDAKLLLEAGVVVAKEEQSAAVAPAAPAPDGFPVRDLSSAQPQQQNQPMPQAPAPSQPNVPSPEEVAAAVKSQPSPEDVAATAAQIQ